MPDEDDGANSRTADQVVGDDDRLSSRDRLGLNDDWDRGLSGGHPGRADYGPDSRHRDGRWWDGYKSIGMPTSMALLGRPITGHRRGYGADCEVASAIPLNLRP